MKTSGVIDKYDRLLDAEKRFGVYVQKPTINAIIMATKGRLFIGRDKVSSFHTCK